MTRSMRPVAVTALVCAFSIASLSRMSTSDGGTKTPSVLATAMTRDAVIAVASTLGVLVPPSLVLILLSDAMLNAHTSAVTATGRMDRVINTQDVFHAA